MNSRRFGLVCVLAAVAAGLPGCCTSGGCRDGTASRPVAPAAINHVVFFKLKDPARADALVADSREMLGRIPGVVSMFAGRHVDAGRANIETGYDACVYVGFADLDDYAAYVAHPDHTGLVAKWRDHFEWYRVYDIEDTTFRPAGAGR